MAVLKFGAIVTEGSGSLGGHTIQKSQGGFQIRSKPIPTGKPSASQTLIRSINPVLQAGWRALTEAQRKIWNDWPVTHGIMNAKGDKHPLSGHSLWMKYNYYWLKAGGTFLPDPSYWGGTILGPELIKNGTFNSSAYWDVYPGWNISGGKANYLDVTDVSIRQAVTFTPGITYRVSFDISGCPSNCSMIIFGYQPSYIFGPPLNYYIINPNGHYSYDVVCIDDSQYLFIIGYVAGPVFSVDNFSIKQIF